MSLCESVVIMSFPPKIPSCFSVEAWGVYLHNTHKIWSEEQMRDLGIHVPYGTQAVGKGLKHFIMLLVQKVRGWLNVFIVK
ncbi:hypothetical protein [Thermoflavimicrobium daqui]|uniref:hypothetical protein n=1 Tax=Thermoflavimicrobium daqui TaxID=2137476 RepID=UPI001F0BACAC|nr:hypothetical protein [Thermoflavimicrobium daqui]